jgi:hypothetical protein
MPFFMRNIFLLAVSLFMGWQLSMFTINHIVGDGTRWGTGLRRR